MSANNTQVTSRLNPGEVAFELTPEEEKSINAGAEKAGRDGMNAAWQTIMQSRGLVWTTVRRLGSGGFAAQRGDGRCATLDPEALTYLEKLGHDPEAAVAPVIAAAFLAGIDRGLEKGAEAHRLTRDGLREARGDAATAFAAGYRVRQEEVMELLRGEISARLSADEAYAGLTAPTPPEDLDEALGVFRIMPEVESELAEMRDALIRVPKEGGVTITREQAGAAIRSIDGMIGKIARFVLPGNS